MTKTKEASTDIDSKPGAYQEVNPESDFTHRSRYNNLQELDIIMTPGYISHDKYPPGHIPPVHLPPGHLPPMDKYPPWTNTPRGQLPPWTNTPRGHLPPVDK